MTGVPFERLMSYVDVFVTHGGHGGVQLALAHGVPIVAAGRTQENVEVNARVAHAGVGINLRTRCGPALRSSARSEPGVRRRAVGRASDSGELAVLAYLTLEAG